MNGGSPTRVTSTPLNRACRGAHDETEEEGQPTGDPGVERGLGHHHRGEDHDGAAGQVDAGGEDDEGLADGEVPDHRDLLDDQRQVVRRGEVAVEEPEDDDADDQHDGRAQPRVPVQGGLHLLTPGPSVQELLGRVVAAREPRVAPLTGSAFQMPTDSAGHARCGAASGSTAPAVRVGLDCGKRSAPAFSGRMRSPCSRPRHRVVGDQRDAGVEEVQPWAVLRLGPVLHDVDDRLDAERGHLERVLLRGCVDDAGLDRARRRRSRRRPRPR